MFPKWLGPLIGTLIGLAAGGLIVWMLGVKAQVWKSSPAGFWHF